MRSRIAVAAFVAMMIWTPLSRAQQKIVGRASLFNGSSTSQSITNVPINTSGTAAPAPFAKPPFSFSNYLPHVSFPKFPSFRSQGSVPGAATANPFMTSPPANSVIR